MTERAEANDGVALIGLGATRVVSAPPDVLVAQPFVEDGDRIARKSGGNRLRKTKPFAARGEDVGEHAIGFQKFAKRRDQHVERRRCTVDDRT